MLGLGLEAKFCGSGLVNHWPRSYVSWPRGLNKFLCDTLNESTKLQSVEPLQQLPKNFTY